jgi:phosphatidate cytidylyltransferase
VSELTRRIIFAVIAAPAGIAAIYFGDWALATMLAVLSALGAWELFRFSKETGTRAFEPAGIALAAFVPIAVHASRLGVYDLPLTGILALVLLVFASSLWFRGPGGRPLASVSITVFGVIYASMITYVYALRYHPYAVGALAGTLVAVLPVLLTWATDIGAYAFGRMFGKTKLMPSVSPGKTIAGAVGGLVLTVIVCLLYVRFLLIPYAQIGFTIQGAVLFGIIVSVAGQTGDLAESLLKREAGVKDSSTLLPGHGGILDRFDSLLFVLPVAYLVIGKLMLPIPR